MAEIEKIAANRYRIRAHGQVMTVSAEDLLDVYSFIVEHATTLTSESLSESESTMTDWHSLQAQAAADVEAVTTDQDAYTFIEKYMSKDLRGRYLQIYRSDRHEMNRSPRQALDNLLSLPPLE